LVDIELNGIRDEEDGLNKDLIRLNGKIVKLNSDLVGIDELEKRKKILTDKETEILSVKTATQERISKLEELQLQLEEIIDGFDEEELEDKIELLTFSRKEFNASKHELEKLDIKINSLNDKKAHLDLHKYNPNCEICMENSETILDSKKDVETQLSEVLEEWGNVIRTNELAEEKINQYSLYESDWKNLQDTKEKEDKVDRELSSLMNKLASSETEEIRIQTQISDQTKLIEEYHQNEEQIKKNGEIREEIKGKRDLLDENKRKFTKTNKLLLELNGKVSSLKNQKETLEDKINEVKKLEEQSKLYEYYLNALSKDGVSYELIEKALPMIEGEVNNILAQIVEFGMQLEMDGKNINAYLVYGDNKWSLEMCSGMERFISGLAIRVALINVCNLPRPNFLVIDEGFGTLDSENLQSLFMLFTYLKTQFDFVMIISHIDSMRDVVDGLIEIKKVDGFSHVKF
jgi:DNA repair exonuclease SbcCD ATPase subunit